MQGLLHMGHVGRDDGFRRSGGDAHDLEALAVHTLRGLPHQTVGLDADGLKVRSILRVGDAQHVVVRASHGVLGERERLALVNVSLLSFCEYGSLRSPILGRSMVWPSSTFTSVTALPSPSRQMLNWACVPLAVAPKYTLVEEPVWSSSPHCV